jgi:hypothetical protein
LPSARTPTPIPIPKSTPPTYAARQFERFELKYWALASQVPDIVRFIEPFLVADTRDQRNVSLYLDTPTLGFYREHLSEAPDRFKLRLRRYEGTPNAVFAEVKRKVKNVVLKKRAMFRDDGLHDVLAGVPVDCDAPGNLDEFCMLVQLTKAQPTMLITCERLAFAAPDLIDDSRLTIDQQIAYQPWRDNFFTRDLREDHPIDGELAHGGHKRRVMLELKFRSVAPMWMAQLVEVFGLRRTSFSKYCTAVRTSEERCDEGFQHVTTHVRGLQHVFPVVWQEA